MKCLFNEGKQDTLLLIHMNHFQKVHERDNAGCHDEGVWKDNTDRLLITELLKMTALLPQLEKPETLRNLRGFNTTEQDPLPFFYFTKSLCKALLMLQFCIKFCTQALHKSHYFQYASVQMQISQRSANLQYPATISTESFELVFGYADLGSTSLAQCIFNKKNKNKLHSLQQFIFRLQYCNY